MKKMLAVAALGTLALSSCSVFGTRSAAVSGQLRGFSADQSLRLALVGFNNGVYTATGAQPQVIDKFLTGGYTLTLPRNVPYGTYRVVVFRDTNNDNRFNTGDVVISRDNGKLLVYSQRDNATYAGSTVGWNIYNTTTRDVQTTLLNNYDLEAVSQ